MYRPLYELSNEYKALINEVVDTETGEIKGSELDFGALVALRDDIENKVKNIGIYYKNEESEADKIKAEIDRLTKRMRHHKAEAERSKNYLMTYAFGVDVDTPKVKVKFNKGRESVNIIDEKAIPDKFIKVTYTPNKTEICKLLKQGEKVAGCELVRKPTVSIK